MTRPIRVCTRSSKLARIQTDTVCTTLRALDPNLQLQVLELSTSGDRADADPRLGGKGEFTRELESALLDGRADVAVHSLKDLPATVPEGLTMLPVGPRVDARDAIVSNNTTCVLRHGARIGTSSVRRAALLKRRTPGIEIRQVRGNVDTRLAKLDRGEVDGLVLAAAGLRRLGLERRIAQALDPALFVPSPCQGIIAVEFREDRDELGKLLGSAVDPDVATAASLERSVVRALGADCLTPLGVYVSRSRKGWVGHGIVLSPNGSQLLSVSRVSPDGRALADELVRSLDGLGAREIIGRP